MGGMATALWWHLASIWSASCSIPMSVPRQKTASLAWCTEREGVFYVWQIRVGFPAPQRLMSPDWLQAQDYGSRLGVQRGGRVSYEPRGPGVLFDALDPTLKRWYVPQELYNEYRCGLGSTTTNARENYQRYVNTAIEGNYFYDLYGNFVTQGWLIYDMRRQQPASSAAPYSRTAATARGSTTS